VRHLRTVRELRQPDRFESVSRPVGRRRTAEAIADGVGTDTDVGRAERRKELHVNRRIPLHQIAAVAGTVHVQRRVCGRPTCRCRRGGRHVGYYLFTREGGRLRKRYIKASEVKAVRAACDERRLRERVGRAVVRSAREKWRAFATFVREVERGDR